MNVSFEEDKENDSCGNSWIFCQGQEQGTPAEHSYASSR